MQAFYKAEKEDQELIEKFLSHEISEYRKKFGKTPTNRQVALWKSSYVRRAIVEAYGDSSPEKIAKAALLQELTEREYYLRSEIRYVKTEKKRCITDFKKMKGGS